MEDKKMKNTKNVIPSAESFSSPDAAGYLFKLIHEGWLRKRYRKRYCVLLNGILYFYEFKTSDGTEKTCSIINLKHYSGCNKAPRKECKKSPNTLILEPVKKGDSFDSTKNAKQIQREYMYTETPEEQEKWVAKLQEALSLTSIGGGKKLTHITKTRARPPRGGNRRPPTKQHIKERALMAEVSLEEPADRIRENGTAKKRGNQPTNALKPPPSFKGKASPIPNLSPKNNKENEEPNSEIAAGDDETDPPSPAASTPKSPLPPPAALKPTSMKRIEVVRTESTGSTDSKRSLPLGSPLPGLVKADLDNSLPSSRSSSIGNGSVKRLNDSPSSRSATPKSEKASPKSMKSSPEHPSPGPPSDGENSGKTSPVVEKLNGEKLSFGLLDLELGTDSRMMKAKSMMELDWDSGTEDLPPPPATEELNELNGDLKKGKMKKENKVKKEKKGKKKKTRPSSLVLDI